MPLSSFTQNYLQNIYTQLESVLSLYPNSPQFKKPAYMIKTMLQAYGSCYNHEIQPVNQSRLSQGWGSLVSFFTNYDKERSKFAAQIAEKIDDNCNNLISVFKEADDYLTKNNIPQDCELAGIWLAFFKLFPFYANALPARADGKKSVLSHYAESALLDNISQRTFGNSGSEPNEIIFSNMQEKIIVALECVMNNNFENYAELIKKIKLEFPVYHAIDYYFEQSNMKSFSAQREAFQQILTEFNIQSEVIIEGLINLVSDSNHIHFSTACHVLALFQLPQASKDKVIALVLTQCQKLDSKGYSQRYDNQKAIFELLSKLTIGAEHAELIITLCKKHFIHFSFPIMKTLCNLTHVPQDMIFTVLHMLFCNSAVGYNQETRDFMLKLTRELTFWDKKFLQIVVEGYLVTRSSDSVCKDLNDLSQSIKNLITKELESSPEIQQEIGLTEQSRSARMSRLNLEPASPFF